MAIDKFSTDILVHELQLGEQLGESVHEQRRSDFSLLLAMLTDDVRAHSQFTLPLSEKPERKVTADTLRQEFQLPKEAALSLENMDKIQAFDQAELIEQNNLDALRLSQVLNPKPLAFRDDASHIAQNIMTNTSLHCQQKYKEKNKPIERNNFNAKAWLTAVKDCMVKSPLIEAYG